MRLMGISKGLRIALVIALVGAAGAVGLRLWRGPTGATAEYGGKLESLLLPDFSSSEPARWVNGAPVSLPALRGEVVFIEAWAPA
jgi:hypothetical protein